MAAAVKDTACVISLAAGEAVCKDCIFVFAVAEGSQAPCCLMAFLLLLEGHIQGDCVIKMAAVEASVGVHLVYTAFVAAASYTAATAAGSVTSCADPWVEHVVE